MASPLVEREQSNFVNAVSSTYARYCPVVMRRLTQAFLAALKNLARKTSSFHRRLTTWYIRLVAARTVQENSVVPGKSLDLFSEEVETLLGEILHTEDLARFSAGLVKQLQNALKSNMSCMLPSYNHQLPNGRESGTYLALDVGGSTFRVALVRLSGPQEDDSGMEVLSLKAYKINDAIKQLVGVAFFDWMAGKIEETIAGHSAYLEMKEVLSMGLAWSFPIEYVFYFRACWRLLMVLGKLHYGVARCRTWEKDSWLHTVCLVKTWVM
jgi:hexokinase